MHDLSTVLSTQLSVQPCFFAFFGVVWNIKSAPFLPLFLSFVQVLFNTPFNTPLNAWLSQDPQLCVAPTYLFPCIWKPARAFCRCFARRPCAYMGHSCPDKPENSRFSAFLSPFRAILHRTKKEPPGARFSRSRPAAPMSSPVSRSAVKAPPYCRIN